MTTVWNYISLRRVLYSRHFHLISVPKPRRSSGHHTWRCNNTFPHFPVFRYPQGIFKRHSCPFLDVIHLFCLPLRLATFTTLCRIVFAMPEDLEMWLYHLSFLSSPWLDHHAFQLHSGFCCEPPRSSHGLCRKCSESHGSFSRFLLSRSSSHRHKGR